MVQIKRPQHQHSLCARDALRPGSSWRRVSVGAGAYIWPILTNWLHLLSHGSARALDGRDIRHLESSLAPKRRANGPFFVEKWDQRIFFMRTLVTDLSGQDSSPYLYAPSIQGSVALKRECDVLGQRLCDQGSIKKRLFG